MSFGIYLIKNFLKLFYINIDIQENDKKYLGSID